MASVPIEMLREGWKVIAEVRDQSGRVLMNAGTIVTLRHKEALMKYGIQVIDVQESDLSENGPAEIDNGERFQAAERSLEPLFAQADRSWEVMAAIHAAAVRMQMERSTAEGGPQ